MKLAELTHAELECLAYQHSWRKVRSTPITQDRRRYYLLRLECDRGCGTERVDVLSARDGELVNRWYEYDSEDYGKFNEGPRTELMRKAKLVLARKGNR